MSNLLNLTNHLIDFFIYFYQMKSILDKKFRGKKVLVRVDFNVPLDKKQNIVDDSRIKASLPTIKKLLNDKARVILMSHLGRPSCKDERFSLKPIVSLLQKFLGVQIHFSNDCIGPSAERYVSNLKNGEVLILENLRFYKEEKLGDWEFSKKLSKLADVYVNDAFGAAHRKHSSTSVVSSFFPRDKYLGLLLKSEIDNLQKALNSPKRPFTAIIGGSKITGKIDVMLSLVDKVDNLIIGGGMAYTFINAMGGSTGKSVVEKDKLKVAKIIMKKAEESGVKLLLPTDSLNADNFSNDANINSSDILNIDSNYMGLDIGNKSILMFSKAIESSKTILWNGPMGVFEMSNFEKGTKTICEAVCRSTSNGAFSLVGGGDSVAAVKKFNLSNKVSYISTGGGAMLEYLEGKELPGIVAILE